CIKIRSRTTINDRIALAPTRTIQQDHPIARLYQRIDIAAEVRPASSTRAGTMQQDNGFVALSAVIKMDAQRFTRFFYIQKTAGGGFGLWLITHHLLLHIQFSVLALNEPNPAIHSGIGR